MLQEKSRGRSRPCGETVLLPFVVHQVLMTFRQINIILCAQSSNPWWVQGDKTCKIEVQLDWDTASCGNRRLAHLDLAK